MSIVSLSCGCPEPVQQKRGKKTLLAQEIALERLLHYYKKQKENVLFFMLKQSVRQRTNGSDDKRKTAAAKQHLNRTKLPVYISIAVFTETVW